jgi:peptide-methionine (S)-S-oxide reductase
MESDPTGELLPGRDEPSYEIGERHAVLGTPLKPPFPDGIEVACFALGCYYAAEQLFWGIEGVYSTAVGFTGGSTPNPTDEEVESGRTGHAETVLVAFDPTVVSYAALLKAFFEGHDPTQGMRQGTEVGTCYRSAIYFSNDAQRSLAEAVRAEYARALRAAGHDPITTEIERAEAFFYGPEIDQQYLHKRPDAIHCALVGSGVECDVPAAASSR